MKRVVVFVVLVTLVAASPAFAAGGDSSAAPARSVAMKSDFSAGAAGIGRMAQEAARKDLVRMGAAPSPTPMPVPPQGGGKSIWKTPWPYLIAGGAIAAIIVVARNTEGGIY